MRDYFIYLLPNICCLDDSQQAGGEGSEGDPAV